MHAIELAYINSGLPGLIGAPTYRQLADVSRPALLEELDEQQIPYRFNKSDNEIFLLEPSSLIRFRTMDEPQRLVGQSLAWFAVDELTYCKENAWERLEARLRHPKAARLEGCGYWTPKGHDWVYRRFISDKRIPGYSCVRAKPAENRAILDVIPDYYERLKASYDDAFYRQEALGEYVGAGSGLAYHKFDAAYDFRHGVGFDPRYPICWTLDFNINPMCSVICQRIPGDPEELFVIDEIVLRQSNTFLALEEFEKRTIPWLKHRFPLEVYVYGDASGRARDSTSFESDWQIIRNWFGQRPHFKPIVKVKRSNPSQRARVVAVNSLFCNALGQRRVSISNKCVELQKDLEDGEWEQDALGGTTGQLAKKHADRGHLADALGYLIDLEFGLKRVMGEKSELLF